MRVLIICICLSVPTNNETVNYFKNTSLLRNIIDSVWKLFYYNKSRGVVLTSLCVRVIMCVRQLKHIYIYIYIYTVYIYIYKNWSPPMFKTWLRP